MLVKILKHIFKLLKRILLFFFSFVVIYLLVAWVCSSIPTTPENLVNQEEIIYVASNGVHTDIIIPIDDLNNTLKEKLKLQPTTRFVAFGWGDKGFYLNTPTWGDLTFSTAVNAVFLTSPTAMHVTEYKSVGVDWKKVMINNNQQLKIQKLITTDFKLRNNNFIKIDGYTYGSNDTFYEAKGSYTCLKTCNTWTNLVLKKSEIKTAIWTPFDWGILKHL